MYDIHNDLEGTGISQHKPNLALIYFFTLWQ